MALCGLYTEETTDAATEEKGNGIPAPAPSHILRTRLKRKRCSSSSSCRFFAWSMEARLASCLCVLLISLICAIIGPGTGTGLFRIFSGFVAPFVPGRGGGGIAPIRRCKFGPVLVPGSFFPTAKRKILCTPSSLLGVAAFENFPGFSGPPAHWLPELGSSDTC